MRDFYLYTSTKITAQDCFEALNKEIKYVEMNGENDIRINAKFRSFIWFNNDRLEDGVYENQEEYEKTKNLIPVKDPYITFLESHRSTDVKRIIGVLIKLYPELYIEADDDNLYCSAQEYLNKEFDY